MPNITTEQIKEIRAQVSAPRDGTGRYDDFNYGVDSALGALKRFLDSIEENGERTCETCATGCLPNERVYVNPDVETPCPGWTSRSPQSADVETVRDSIDWNIGNLPCTRPDVSDCHARAGTDMRCMNGIRCAALDRIAGKGE